MAPGGTPRPRQGRVSALIEDECEDVWETHHTGCCIH